MPTSTLRCRCGCKNRGRREDMLITPSKAAFINADHAASYAKSRGAKLRKRADKAKRQELNERKKRNRENDHKWQTARTQAAFNEMVRLLDKDEPCISCGKDSCGHIWDCGHFKTVGAFPQLRFEARNAFKQGSACNRPQERGKGSQAAVTDGFQRGIIERHGEALLLWLGGYHPPKNYSCGDLADLRAVFLAEIKRLKQGQPPSRNWRSIQSQEARLAGRGEQDRAA